jgi:AcrR family transcriptional regulator
VRGSTAPIDGRTARATRTRDAIVQATVALVEEGDLRPTAPRIAARAGVSVRSVFQHFDDLPALHTAVVHRVFERLAVLVGDVDPALPLDQRIEAFSRARAALLEAVTPFRRAGAVHGPFAPQLREAMAQGVAYLRAETEHAFAPELDAVPAADRRLLLDTVVAATSWGVWEALRADADATPEEARAVVARLLTAVLR